MFDLFAYGGEMCCCGDSSTLGNLKHNNNNKNTFA